MVENDEGDLAPEIEMDNISHVIVIVLTDNILVFRLDYLIIHWG